MTRPDAPPDPGRASPRPRDVAWALVAGVFAVLFGANVVAVFVLIAAADLPRLLVAPFSLLVTYWFMAGAFQRTIWRNPARRAAPPGPPVLSERRAKIYVYLALGCALALVVATAGQLLAARSS